MTSNSLSGKDLASARMEELRQAAMDRLTEAFAADQITMEEYERRASLANLAARPPALDDLTFDLPAINADGQKGGHAARSRRSSGSFDLIGAPPVTTGCVMGDRHLTGNWLTSDRVSTFTVMGSTKIDLRDVDLPPGATKIEVFTLIDRKSVV